MAGDGREAMVEPALQRLGAVLGREILREVAQQPRHVAPLDQRRGFAQQHRAGAEAFDDEAERLNSAACSNSAAAASRIEIDDERRQQNLALDAVLARAGASTSRRRCARARRAGRR